MHSVFDERPLAQAMQVIVYSGRIIYNSIALQGGQPISDHFASVCKIQHILTNQL